MKDTGSTSKCTGIKRASKTFEFLRVTLAAVVFSIFALLGGVGEAGADNFQIALLPNETSVTSSGGFSLVKITIEFDDFLIGLGNDSDATTYPDEEAKVVCRQLDKTGGTGKRVLYRNIVVYDGSINMKCEGSEPRLSDCEYRLGIGLVISQNEEYVLAVKCEDATNNNRSTGSVTISGTAQEGETLTADHSGISDDDGKPTDESSYSYNWFRGTLDGISSPFTEISGATSATYVIQKEDVGGKASIKVKVSFTDDENNEEAVTSAEVGYPVIPADGSLRLLDSNAPRGSTELVGDNKGRVDIYDGEEHEWKGICDDGWGDEEAEVACRQLGLPTGDAIGHTEVGRGYCPGGEVQGSSWLGGGGSYCPLFVVYSILPFELDDVVCVGTETRLLDCTHAGRGIDDCSGAEYAGVTCQEAAAE